MEILAVTAGRRHRTRRDAVAEFIAGIRVASLDLIGRRLVVVPLSKCRVPPCKVGELLGDTCEVLLQAAIVVLRGPRDIPIIGT
jgi:hypothetical protein